MDPVTAMMFGSAALGALSSYEASKANAAVARRNAELARISAADALQRGEQRAWKVRMTSGRRMAMQRVAYAHAGVDVSSGTPAQTISTTGMVGELDALTERSNAYRQAWGMNQQAANFEAQANAYDKQALFGAIGAGLSGAGMAFAKGG